MYLTKMRRTVRGALLAGLCLAWWVGAPVRAQDVTPEQVRNAIKDGKASLLRTLAASQNTLAASRDHRALQVMALLNCQVSPDDPVVANALVSLSQRADVMTSQQYMGTYQASLLLVMYEMAGKPQYKKVCTVLARRLLRYQSAHGGWGDYSRTQFALLGLKAAEDMGIEIPDTAFVGAQRYVISGQNDDGGWGYKPQMKKSYGSMTVAGLSSLYICGARLYAGRESCEKPGGIDVRIARGLNWIGSNFSVRRNPNAGGHLYYYLYGLERVGMLMAQRTIGGHDWYREGAAFLVARQAGDGRWRDESMGTEFAMLFLGKGSKPIAMQKLEYEDKSGWNLDPYDAKNLIERCERELKTPMTFQVTNTSATAEELAMAPILYLQGNKSFKFDDAFRKNLKAFISQGGFVFASAACGKQNFDESFRAEIKKLFPESNFERLPPDHPLYGNQHRLQDPRVFMLEGVDVGCRTAILYAPKDIACAWGGDCACDHDLVVNDEEAVRLGVNMVAYALGLQKMRDRLDKIKIEKPEEAKMIPRGTLAIGQLYHSGGWNPGPAALPNLSQTLKRHTGTRTEITTRRVVLGADDPADYPMLYLTGYRGFEFTGPQIKVLRQYLDRGGFLLADPWCGREEFDRAFKRLIAEMYPGQEMKRLPLAHPLFRQPFDIKTVQYKYRVKENFPLLGDEPHLEAIEKDGRAVVVYSRFNLGCELQGTAMPHSLGVKGEDAYRIAVNALMYALSR